MSPENIEQRQPNARNPALRVPGLDGKIIGESPEQRPERLQTILEQTLKHLREQRERSDTEQLRAFYNRGRDLEARIRTAGAAAPFVGNEIQQYLLEVRTALGIESALNEKAEKVLLSEVSRHRSLLLQLSELERAAQKFRPPDEELLRTITQKRTEALFLIRGRNDPESAAIVRQFNSTLERVLTEGIPSALDRFRTAYETGKAAAANTADTIQFMGRMRELGYAHAWFGDHPEEFGYGAFLAGLIRRFQSVRPGEQIRDGERQAAMISDAAHAVGMHLQHMEAILRIGRGAPGLESSPAYASLLASYRDECKEYAIVRGGIDKDVTRTDVRDGHLAADKAAEAMTLMPPLDAVKWLRDLNQKIKEQPWKGSGRSAESKAAQAEIMQACIPVLSLQLKRLEQEARQSADPRRMEEYRRLCLDLAARFRNRETTGAMGYSYVVYERFESHLRNDEFALHLTKQAMDHDELVQSYARTSRLLTDKKRNAILANVEYRRDGVLNTFLSLPPADREGISILDTVSLLGKEPENIQDLAAQYSRLNMLEWYIDTAQKKAQGMPPRPPPDPRDELTKLSPLMMQMEQEFEKFLNNDGRWTGTPDTETVGRATGTTLSDCQKRAHELLTSMKGYGLRMSDSAAQKAETIAKATGMLAAGIAVGIATGGAGLGIAGAMLVEGAAFTALQHATDDTGFDTKGEALLTVGRQFALNAALSGAGRALNTVKAAGQLKMVGGLTEAGGFSNIVRAGLGKHGARALGELTKDIGITGRLIGTSAESIVNALAAAELMHLIEGGEFSGHLVQNLYFAGLPIGFEVVSVASLRMKPLRERKRIVAAGMELQKELNMLDRQLQGMGVDVSSIRNLAELEGLLAGKTLPPGAMQDVQKSVTRITDLGANIAGVAPVAGVRQYMNTQEELPTVWEKNIQSIRQATDDQLEAWIMKFNNDHPEGMPQRSFRVVKSTERGIVTVNERGQMEFIEINKANARDVLSRVKKFCDRNPDMSGYEARQECMRRDPSIKTYQAYTLGELPKEGTETWKYIADPNNWVPEKRVFHEKLFNEMMESVRANSERMATSRGVGQERIVVMLRGNTAAGKSSILHSANSPRLRNLNIDPRGAINPDNVKAVIRQREKVADRHMISHPQAHNEGSMLATRVINRSFEENLNMVVIDKRFASAEDVAEVTSVAKEKGYRVIMIDVDAELQTSMDRVYGNPEKGIKGRDPNGDDPVVPMNIIERGYRDVVKHRKEVIDLVDEYYLYKTDTEATTPPLIAQKADGKVTIHNREIFDHTSRDPQRDAFVGQAMENLQNTSRTSKGIVDTSATKEKASSIAEGLSKTQAAERANGNFEKVMKELFNQRSRDFQNPVDLQNFVEGIARDVNEGILKDGLLLRRANSEKFPYTKVEDFPQATKEFYEEFHRRLLDPRQDPVELAAWVEFNVDLSHHFFEDGCGKISKALSSWVLARKELTPPRYRGREEYYQHAPKMNSSNNPVQREGQLKQWLDYYRTLHDGSAL